MQTHTPETILENYLNWWTGHTRETSQIHERFLEMRQAGLHQLAGDLEHQIETHRSLYYGMERVVLTIDDLKEFATGSVVKCLGEEYAVYAGRRSLRIPNGDLLLMSRILSIQGRKEEFDQPSSIVAEFDVPEEAWYFEGEKRGRLPYSICIEIALQPCGVLSAYLGTPLRFPNIDYSFRNLDGETTINHQVDSRGKTIRARALLLKTIFYGSTIIQHFSFELFCDGKIFFEGKSSFGYFSAEAMAGQTGLDSGNPVLPWLKQAGLENQISSLVDTTPWIGLPSGKLLLIDRAAVNSAGNKGDGYVYASRKNSPQDWFYACHFQEDPVMPGSLGIEAILQAMKIYIQQESHNQVTADYVTGQKMNWRYRGQVLQHHRQMQVEVFIHKPQKLGITQIFTGDGSLWADDSRIYEVHNICIAVEEP
jgi:3-hydroxymyristoyl/3-hydroxydecanoyl-(acyl carrier protein) dehydratase